MTTTLPPCPIGQHIEEFTYRWHVIHFCFTNGPSQPMHIDWPMALAIAVGVGLIITAVVYFAGILIVGHLYKKAEDINNGKSQHHLR